MAYYDKYDMQFEAKAVAPIEIAPGDWIGRSFLRQVQRELGHKYFGQNGCSRCCHRSCGSLISLA